MSGPAGFGGKAVLIVACVWLCTLICLPFIFLRLYTRRYLRGGFGSDDYCLMTDWVLFVVFSSFVTVACHYGMGQHASALDNDQISHTVLYIVCAQFFVALAIGLGKVTVAVFLYRIVIEHWHKWFLWFFILTMSFFSILTSISAFTQCTPLHSIWDPRLADKRRCNLKLATTSFMVSSYAVFVDFALAVFPWVALRSLMKRKERMLVCASLSLGVFAGICGIFRTAELGQLYNSQDYTYATTKPGIWTAAEASITIICVSLPVLRPLWVRIRRKPASTVGSEGNHKLFNMSPGMENGVQTVGSSPFRQGVTIPSQDIMITADGPRITPETSRGERNEQNQVDGSIQEARLM